MFRCKRSILHAVVWHAAMMFVRGRFNLFVTWEPSPCAGQCLITDRAIIN